MIFVEWHSFTSLLKNKHKTNLPIYKAIKGLATANRKNINPIPEYNDVLAAVRTTPSPGNSSLPNLFFFSLVPRANADAYKFVVATFRNAKRYNEPSIKVVAGPNAASCAAEPAAPTAPALADNPMKDVSTKDSNGPDIHNAKHGK